MFGFMLWVYILVCYGLSNMVVYSKGPFHIFENWRTLANNIHPHFGELFSCMMCFPFWAGVIFSLLDLFLIPIGFTPFNIICSSIPLTFFNVLFIVIMDGILSSGTTWVINNIEEYFEQ